MSDFIARIFKNLLRRYRSASQRSAQHYGLPDDNSEWVPPDSIPNSEVKLLSADGSVGVPM